MIASYIHRMVSARRAYLKKQHYRENWDKVGRKLLNGKGGEYDSAYRKDVVQCWKQYDVVNPDWANYYYLCNGIKSLYYIPSDIYFGKICRVLNRKDSFSYPLLQDKNYLDLLFPDVRRPETIAHCINGELLDKNYRRIDFDSLLEEIIDVKEVLIKPTIDSTGARNVCFISRDNSFSERLSEEMQRHGKDYIIQKVLVQNSRMAALNPDSINTVRVLSLLWNEQVIILGSLVRIGVKGIRVDNLVASEGISCGIDSEGCFIETGYNRFGSAVTELPNGIKLKGYEIPGFQNIISAVKENHSRLAHFRLIGWDYTVDEDDTPILIEANMDFPEIEFHQLAMGPLLGEGELFHEVLDAVYRHPGNFIA